MTEYWSLVTTPLKGRLISVIQLVIHRSAYYYILYVLLFDKICAKFLIIIQNTSNLKVFFVGFSVGFSLNFRF